MKLLFICSKNRLRSPTAEVVFSTLDGLEVMSAGTSPDADNPVLSELLLWADVIFVMENVHRQKLNQRFGTLVSKKRLIVLDIPDRYDYMHPELVQILKTKVSGHLKLKR